MLKNGFYNVLIGLSGPLINLLSIPIATRALGIDGFGEASIVISFVSFFLVISSLGLTVYGTREIALLDNDNDKKSSLFSELFFINLASSLVFSFIYVCLSFYLNFRNIFIAIGFFSILINSLNIEWLFFAHQNYKTIATRTIVSRIITLLLVIFFVNDENDVELYLIATLISYALPFAFNFSKYRKYVDIKLSGIDLKKHFNKIWHFFKIRVFSSIYTSLDVAIVGILVSSSASGIYAISIRIVRIISTVICAMTGVYLAKISSLYKEKDGEGEELLVDILVFTIASSLLAMLWLHEFSEYAVKSIAGKDFLESIEIIKLLVFLIPLVALSNYMGMQLLYPSKKEKVVASSLMIGSIIGGGGTIFLASVYGVKGAAFAVLIAESLICIIQFNHCFEDLYSLYKRNAIRIKNFLALTFFWLLVCILIKFTVVADGIYFSILKAFLFFIFYGLGFVLIRKNRFFK